MDENNTVNKLMVLLVEDEPIVQKVHVALLKRMGCCVELAENGEQVLAKKHHSYDIIFMDVGLPDISGIELIARIRRCESVKKDIPIIVITGFSDSKIAEECLKAGANAVFTKPIEPSKLKQILQEYVLNRVEKNNLGKS